MFDTAFFRRPAGRRPPPTPSTGPIAAEHQVRRYGFHGTSHQYVSEQVARVLGRDADRTQADRAAPGQRGLGVGDRRRPGGGDVDGPDPAGGSGDGHPQRRHRSRRGVPPGSHRPACPSTTWTSCSTAGPGMLGLAGVSDFRDLHRLIADGDADAALALDVYCHRVRKYVGAYLAVLGGADVITFTAGVGENDAVVRAKVLAGSGTARYLGRSGAQRGAVGGAAGDLDRRFAGDGDGGADQRGAGDRPGDRWRWCADRRCWRSCRAWRRSASSSASGTCWPGPAYCRESTPVVLSRPGVLRRHARAVAGNAWPERRSRPCCRPVWR